MSAIWARAKTAFSERLTRTWSPHARANRSATALATFTFDDFPRSAATTGARVLREYGARGTYFVAGARAGRDVDGMNHFTADDLIEVAEDGHEVGCHTFGHIRLPTASSQEIEDDLSRNRDFVNGILGDYRMTSFAYPYGQASIAAKSFIARHFAVARGIGFGVNKRRVDLALLRAVSLERTFDHARVLKTLDAAKASNGWVLFFTHDISDTPSPYGCKPQELARVVEAVLERGITILPMKHAAAKVLFSQRSGAPC
jgi:peptidoglycan/xylan/chitin deacetylase (PgdA/CDA1 family)